jgi:AraC-like DNA-binding protein
MSMRFDVIPVPEALKRDVECFRVSEYSGTEGVSIKVAPKALPGIAFQHDNGRSALENIITPSHVACPPTLFLYGAVIQPSIMNYKAGSYSNIQVVLKPHALKSLFGLNGTALANGSVELNEFSDDNLNMQLIEAKDVSEQITRLTRFLLAQLKREQPRDELVEESLNLIHQNAATVSVKSLLQHLNISERHFERRFSQTVGVSPQSYIRVRRFNEAIRLIKTRQYEKLTDIAHTLYYYDQSHFTRDIKTLAGITPKDISSKEGDSYHDQLGYSYV